jgi:hypothetical protein
MRMKIQSVLSRYRLLTSVLALALALGALAYSPQPALAAPECQEMGCVEWSVQTGCTATMFCCTGFSDGGYLCWRNGVLVQ